MLAPTGAQAADFDRWAIEERGVPQPSLMENAGRAAAALLTRLWPSGDVTVVAGAGNNGGDALVAARTLAAWGRRVVVVYAADRALPDPLLHDWLVPIHRDSELDDAAWERLLAAEVVVDGILGTGVRGAPRSRQAAVIERLNRAGGAVLSLDVPSGVDAGDGSVPGPAVRADATIAFGAPKLGTLLHPGRAHTGRLVAVEIGFPPLPPGAGWAVVATPRWARARLPERDSDTHKNAVGRLLVVAGRAGMAGAAVLAARAGFRAGAGLVQVCSPAANRPVIQAALPEAIYVDPGEGRALEVAAGAAHAVVAGPGLGTDDEASALLCRTLEACAGRPMLLDADALNLVAGGRAPALQDVAGSRPLLVTPHPGEMARLRPGEDAARTALVRRAASEWGCAVLLKGAPSLVADGEELRVDVSGSSDLAVAGMGDVLSGVCGGLMAQGLSPGTAASVGLALTGRAATLAGRGAALVPGDVVRWLAEARTEQAPDRTDLGLAGVIFDLDPAR